MIFLQEEERLYKQDVAADTDDSEESVEEGSDDADSVRFQQSTRYGFAVYHVS